jgi:hypothetical protein
MRTTVLRVSLMAAAAACAGFGLLAAEPGFRASQKAEAGTDWQLILSNEGAWCEGCCWGLCCSISAECRVPIG